MHSIKDTVKQLIGKSLDAYNKKYTSPINNRIDNIVAQAGTDNTEIVDARIDSAGVSHTTLNNRILAETKMTDEKLIEYTGSSLSVDDTMPGYLQNIEIKGNTIQNEDNLEDIRSVGDKIEGQELYEIPVLSRGKNLINETSIILGEGVTPSNGQFTTDANRKRTNFIKFNSNTNYVVTNADCILFYDVNKQYISYNNSTLKGISPSNCAYAVVRMNINATNIQLEEGTVSTEYEPYQEDKLTILSPVQLEKVGDIADRLIEKDGVWGVEKNIETLRLSSNSPWYSQTNKSGIKLFVNRDYLSNGIRNRVILCDVLTVNNGINQEVIDGYNQILAHKDNNYSQNIYISKDFENTTLFTAWLDENPVNIKYVTETEPQFIPLPHDQQVKLRTFANKTNISFLTKIEGTIKAQVPKSLGATVNTHATQISNLNKELDRVKKLEESTVSTVETESDFTVVEATSNGYFEDVKLEGKTLVNLVKGGDVEKSIGVSGGTLSKYNYLTPLKNNTLYTVILNIDAPDEDLTKLNISLNGGSFGHVNKCINGISCFTLTTNETPHNEIWVYFTVGSTIVGTPKLSNVVVLEGDHTQNPPNGYIEGLKSVGQSASEDGTDEIVVSSVNAYGNLWDGKLEVGSLNASGDTDWIPYVKTGLIRVKPSSEVICKIGKYKGETATSTDIRMAEYDMNKKFIKFRGGTYKATVSDKTHYVKFAKKLETSDTNRVDISAVSDVVVVYGNELHDIPHQSDKKRLLFYNEGTQAWEKPILREWDSIEKHANGKYYYHQRSAEVVLNGSENWSVRHDLPTDNPQGTHLVFYVQDENFPIKARPNDTSSIVWISDILQSLSHTYGWNTSVEGLHFGTFNKSQGTNNCRYYVNITKSKLSTQDVAGFKQWLQTNNMTVVYQLAEEKVYECTNIDLITYANETNYIVESGVIVPRSTLKVHNNISNVVSLLQKKVSLLESNMTKYMITQNRMQLTSTYSADSVTFKVDYTLCSEEVEYNEDLYNLILNNILVGEDNYDYNKMFNIIMDYASWSQISWDQFDILVGIMDMQHNPPVEDEIVEEIPNEVM